LPVLPPKSRAALNDLKNCVDSKIARLRYSSSIETEGFRQAKYLNGAKSRRSPTLVEASAGVVHA
jgi:hypothetical protein